VTHANWVVSATPSTSTSTSSLQEMVNTGVRFKPILPKKYHTGKNYCTSLTKRVQDYHQLIICKELEYQVVIPECYKELEILFDIDRAKIGKCKRVCDLLMGFAIPSTFRDMIAELRELRAATSTPKHADTADDTAGDIVSNGEAGSLSTWESQYHVSGEWDIPNWPVDGINLVDSLLAI